VNEYYTVKHQFRFQIEKLGIISKNTPLQSHLHQTPTIYGWAGHDQVWINGLHHQQYNGYQRAMDIDHIIELFIDCDRQKVCFTSESTSITHEIDISIKECAFPWIFYIGLYGADDQMRLLTA
jgi:hypothetical protein